MQSFNLNNKAVILSKIKKPLIIKKIFLPKINENLVLIKMKYSFVCGSQINEWQGKKGKDKFLPHTLGHEGCGEIIDFGKSPVSPIEPSPTIIIGAIARIGMVCEAMIQGITLRFKVGI